MTRAISGSPTAPGATPEPATNIYASTAFVFSMIGAVGLSVICAITALVQIKNPGEGRGQAVAGLLISAAWVAALSVLVWRHAL
ncbi:MULTISPECIES: hypothetical protein [Mycobacterium]|uniref:DUF4190 domain-containing protein n=1 Tax=Mycobacterium kiyosense TaxID=2871094 RepID=A0A9P3UVE6_9MYCO|nr:MULTISPECIES: hypothetical protein [Mycobacterium]BDB45444.1 hypothetical protein IWGMT90018_58900 [Mycobacterium kiyosense]BDE16902.1 hypothetical protein MKCMC460_57620 [Mycobacterium sp. 20KCMC460]GLB84427.1 hypothetical protein SRL2020028_36830 [Mycobacterium kiyosense]GLB91066.1 hypothetical protein SRL2020130_38830 [Mycobacterium kiyosense]GLB96934.1 hypothetical protein SRL2020226_37100 [Mycobacterium kiyosense]